MTKPKPGPRPRVGFCWYCGRRLQGRHHAVATIDGHERVLHKACLKYPRNVIPDYELLGEASIKKPRRS